MNPLAKILSFIAPYNCLGCNAEGRLVCMDCRTRLLPAPVTGRSVIAVTTYADPIAEKLLWRLKSDRAIAAAQEIAEMMAPLLCDLSKPFAITHLPTAPSRIRLRGYDQSQQIAKHLARLIDQPYQPLLIRQTNVRQVGTGRKDRQRQAAEAFRPRYNNLEGATVLIVDDVMTTGASLRAAAHELRSAGAGPIMAVVFALA